MTQPNSNNNSSLFLDKRQLEASICRDSFYDFVQRFWSTTIHETPVWNWHIKILCDYLQMALERVFLNHPRLHDIVINIPPGTTKSTIASVMLPAWAWTRMPSLKTISSSYAHSLAISLARKSRDVILSEKYQALFPGITLRDDQNAKGHYENVHQGMRFAVGTEGLVTGQHAHLIVIDDPMDPLAAISEAELAKVNRFITETLPTRKVDKEVSLTILIMQRLHQNDPSQVLLDEAMREGGTPIKHIKLPGITDNPYEEVRPRKFARFYKDGLLDPVRLSRKVLRELEERLGQYGFAGQIRQIPVPPGGGMFHVDKLTIEPPPPGSLVKRVRFWDKAATKGGGAYSAGVLMGLDGKGHFYVLDVVRGQWDSGTREKIIHQTAKLDGKGVVVGVEQEPGSGGKESAEKTVHMLAGFRCRVQRPSGDKVVRADPFSVQVNWGNVSLSPGDWTRDYINELKHFPFSTYKDQVDASSGAFSLLSNIKRRVGGIK